MKCKDILQQKITLKEQKNNLKKSVWTLCIYRYQIINQNVIQGYLKTCKKWKISFLLKAVFLKKNSCPYLCPLVMNQRYKWF